RCPGCEAVLESPRSERGTYLRCPACGIHLTIPTDALYNDDREEPDHTWYAFPCPSCRLELRTTPEHAHKTAVCPFCLRAVKVPAGGDPVVPPPPTSEDGRGSLQAEEPLRPCPRCGLQMAARARVCRSCGAQFS